MRQFSQRVGGAGWDFVDTRSREFKRGAQAVKDAQLQAIARREWFGPRKCLPPRPLPMTATQRARFVLDAKKAASVALANGWCRPLTAEEIRARNEPWRQS